MVITSNTLTAIIEGGNIAGVEGTIEIRLELADLARMVNQPVVPLVSSYINKSGLTTEAGLPYIQVRSFSLMELKENPYPMTAVLAVAEYETLPLPADYFDESL